MAYTLCYAAWLLVLLQAGDAGGPLCRSFTILGALCTDGSGSNSTNSTGSSLGGCEAWDALCLPEGTQVGWPLAAAGGAGLGRVGRWRECAPCCACCCRRCCDSQQASSLLHLGFWAQQAKRETTELISCTALPARRAHPSTNNPVGCKPNSTHNRTMHPTCCLPLQMLQSNCYPPPAKHSADIVTPIRPPLPPAFAGAAVQLLPPTPQPGVY